MSADELPRIRPVDNPGVSYRGLDASREAARRYELTLVCGQCSRTLDSVQPRDPWPDEALLAGFGAVNSVPAGKLVAGSKMPYPPERGRPRARLEPQRVEIAGEVHVVERWVCHPRRCGARYTVRRDQLAAAWVSAVEEKRQELIAGVDVG